MLTQGAAGGYSVFLRKLGGHLEEKPWLLPYDLRRNKSKEERAVHQLRLEQAWSGTPVEVIWQTMRRHALPSKDYLIDRNTLADFLNQAGVSSRLLIQNLCNFFFEQLPLIDTCISGLHFCQAILISLLDPLTSSLIIAHCFESLPHNPEKYSVVDMKRINTKLEGLGKKKPSIDTGELERLTAVKELLVKAQITEMDIDVFTTAFLEEGSGLFVSKFMKQIFEACAKYYKEPFGKFPLISLRWLNTTLPVEYNSTTPMDADSLLLQSFERSGKDQISKKKTPRKKKRSTSSRR